MHLVEKMKAFYKGDLNGKHFAIWGLAFKPNTDDIREAPALSIIAALQALGATITAYDPEAMPAVKSLLGTSIYYADNQYDALAGADALIIATEWSEFRTPDFNRMDITLLNKIIFDGRNLFDLANMQKLGYYYASIGRATTHHALT
jgi:UDPglucose 6-dehydrogenase